jgi:hypothetical protein
MSGTASTPPPIKQPFRQLREKFLRSASEAEHEAMGGPWLEDKGTIIRVLTANADLSAIKVRGLKLYGSD